MVNQATAANSKLGKYIPTIDFELFNTSKSILDTKGDNAPMGKFWVDGKSQTLTIKEVNSITQYRELTNVIVPTDLNRTETDYIFDTFERAKSMFFKKFRLGI